jgi:DeoR/GlpR family transcriptional regulator of sugar metabolism
MLVEERRRRLVEHVQRRGVVAIAEMSELLGASQVTVRRDLRAVAAQGLVVRAHGGALAPRGGWTREPSYAEKATKAAAEKVAIARIARRLITRGQSVILGPGTTTLALAQLLGGIPDLTVVTNSLLVAEALMSETQVEALLTGGQLRREIHALVGPATEDAVRHLCVSTTFISGNGLTVARGLSTPNPLVAATDRALVAAAERVIVLADHTKVGIETMCQTVPLDHIGVLVTDAAADLQQIEAMRELGVEVIVGDPMPSPSDVAPA